MIEKESVLISRQEADNLIVIFTEQGSTLFACESICKIEMQPYINVGVAGQFRCPFGILHENHGTRRCEASAVVTRHDPVSCKETPPKVISIEDKHVVAHSIGLWTIACHRQS